MYEKSGVLEYIIVDPKAKNVEVFRRTGGNLKTYAALEKWDEVLSAKADDNGRIYIKTLDLTIDLNDIFTEI